MSDSYFGFEESSPCLKMTWEELLDMCTGRLIVSIGKGSLRDEMSLVGRMIGGWVLYQEEKRNNKW